MKLREPYWRYQGLIHVLIHFLLYKICLLHIVTLLLHRLHQRLRALNLSWLKLRPTLRDHLRLLVCLRWQRRDHRWPTGNATLTQHLLHLRALGLILLLLTKSTWLLTNIGTEVATHLLLSSGAIQLLVLLVSLLRLPLRLLRVHLLPLLLLLLLLLLVHHRL